MEKLTALIHCAVCHRWVTGYEHEKSIFPYRHKDGDGWCTGHGSEALEVYNGTENVKRGSLVEQHPNPGPDAPVESPPETPAPAGEEEGPAESSPAQEVQLPAMPEPMPPPAQRSIAVPEVLQPKRNGLPTLWDVFPEALQSVVPRDLDERYLPLCWLVWKTALERGEQRPRRVVDLRERKTGPAPEEAHKDLYATAEPEDPLAEWTPPPGGIVDTRRVLEQQDDDEDDFDEDGDEERPRTRVVRPQAANEGEGGDGVESRKLGQSGFSMAVERGLVEFAQKQSTDREEAAVIAIRELTRMRKGGDKPPGSAGKIILTALLNAKILKGAGKDGFLERKMGRAEDLDDGDAAASAGRLGMDERAAELGIVSGEE